MFFFTLSLTFVSLQVFRSYRSHYDEQKHRLQDKSRELLEDSVKDALRLAAENKQLRAELDAARLRLSAMK